MAIISVSPALVALLPTGSEVWWVGVDSTTPDGFFGAVGINHFGFNSFWLVAGTPETPTAIAGRVSSGTVYGGWNRHLGSSNESYADCALIVQDHIRHTALA